MFHLSPLSPSLDTIAAHTAGAPLGLHAVATLVGPDTDRCSYSRCSPSPPGTARLIPFDSVARHHHRPGIHSQSPLSVTQPMSHVGLSLLSTLSALSGVGVTHSHTQRCRCAYPSLLPVVARSDRTPLRLCAVVFSLSPGTASRIYLLL